MIRWDGCERCTICSSWFEVVVYLVYHALSRELLLNYIFIYLSFSLTACMRTFWWIKYIYKHKIGICIYKMALLWYFSFQNWTKYSMPNAWISQIVYPNINCYECGANFVPTNKLNRPSTYWNDAMARGKHNYKLLNWC